MPTVPPDDAAAPWSARLLAALGAAADVLLPGECVLCGGAAGGRIACASCHAEHLRCARPRCRVCANPLAEGADGAAGARLCGRCVTDRPAFDATFVAVDYALPLDRLVLQLKFRGRLALAALFGRALADAALAAPGFARPALLCPVPLGPKRLAGRGFNQALEIARPLSRALGVELHPRLAVRVHDTAAQSLVEPSARGANVARAFALRDRALVEGRHIGLVDDVMTSGETLNALAATFKRYGAARVTCLVFARTPPHYI
ncbi:ComF family protein [Pseudoduganella namucuonensis]|uniref:ComF family protein n=1 Tax=Pseudoduganella namucuonensis TaxID=1035707 RepID=A0A1I7EWA7_9BURK|nr:ComF family protein [Pseudoduganella namucuonensis]SFU28165.1 comF family protein [Pseudoduganella namucuonensis]